MEVCLYNIQGFRGEYRYEIDTLVTIINSKHNGVGKTTLYDCLRFLCDSSLLDKEEQEFFLNLNEEQGLFSITKNEVTYGFILTRGKPPVFYRQIEGDGIERQAENFVTAPQDIGLLAINGALLNIFSKEVDLLSSSHSGKNYQLIKEITTHQQTEEMLDLIIRSININQESLSNLRAEKKGIDAQVSSIPYFLYTDQLQSLLDDTFYEGLETFLIQVDESLGKLKQVEELTFNSELEKLLELEESLNLIQVTDLVVPDTNTLELVDGLAEVLERVQPLTDTQLNPEPLEYMVKLCESLDKLQHEQFLNLPDLTLLQKLDELIVQVDKIDVVPEISVDSYLPNKLANICIKLGELTTTINQELRFNQLAETNKETLASTRVQCPIRQEVYLINGKCHY